MPHAQCDSVPLVLDFDERVRSRTRRSWLASQARRAVAHARTDVSYAWAVEEAGVLRWRGELLEFGVHPGDCVRD